MKVLLRVSVVFMGLFLALQVQAYEVWHTASGKSYPVYTSTKVGKKGSKSQFYIVSYKTKKHLDDKYGLLMEYYDLLTQLYYFHIPAKLRSDEFSSVTIQAFNKAPKGKKHKAPSRRFTKSVSDLAKIVKNHKRTDRNRLRAFRNFNKQKFKKALQYFKKVKKRVPHDVAQMSNIHMRLAQREKAIALLKSGLRENPKNVTLLNNLAMATLIHGTFLLEGKFEYDPKKVNEAKKILKKAMKQSPKNWVAHLNMAVLELTIKNHKKAEESYLRALKLSNQAPELEYQVGNFYHGQKKFGKAQEYYQQALAKFKGTRMPAVIRPKALQKRIKHIEGRLDLAKQNKMPK